MDSPSDRALEQIAERQARRRRFNARLADLDPQAEVARFRCECGLIACGVAIPLSASEYAAVRSDAVQFAVSPEHVLPEADRVVAAHDGWVAIAKPPGRGEEIAARIEPLSSSVETEPSLPTSRT